MVRASQDRNVRGNTLPPALPIDWLSPMPYCLWAGERSIVKRLLIIRG